MVSLNVFLHFQECTFIILNVAVVTVNKYVLSTLHFTIPTVFQGWQTFVCVFLLTLLMYTNQLRVDFLMLERRTFFHLILPMLCFSLSNVAGSKALAVLPVAVFVSGTSLVPLGMMLWGEDKVSGTGVKAAAGLALCSSIIALYVMSIEPATGWFWLCFHVVAQLGQIRTLNNLRLPPMTAVYLCNLSSVIFLLPLSVYLQEASSAFHHARNADTEFFLGCIFSGILGTGLQLLTGHLPDKLSVPLYQGVSKILTCTLAIIIFPNNLSYVSWLLVVLNLVLSCFAFGMEETKPENTVQPEIAQV